MAALLTLFSLLLFAPPAPSSAPDSDQMRRQVRREAKRFARAGHPDVAKIYRLAAPEYREAIPAALETVDPEGLHPEWELELWRICRREAWCGHYGRVTVHERDGWAGAGVYIGALADGLLRPETCPAHRLRDYAPAARAVEHRVRQGRWSRSAADRMLARLAELEAGEHPPEAFSTRGGFGQMQGRHLHILGECVGPEAADDPRNAARIAAVTIAGCRRWEGEPGARYRRYCTCTERTRKWVGGGRWDQRSFLRNLKSVSTQCGDPEAARFMLSEALAFVGDRPWWVVALVGFQPGLLL